MTPTSHCPQNSLLNPGTGRTACGVPRRVGCEAVTRRRAGRPAGSGTKEQVAIRVDREVLAAFRAAGPGWQTRMNEALKDWLKTHSPA